MKNVALVGILSLVFPIFALAGVAAKAAYDQNVGGEVWQVKIGGYDPRDLLYGHYLVYRYEWNMVESSFASNPSQKTEHCLCVNSADNTNIDPEVYGMSCEAPASSQCQSVVRGYSHWNNNFSFNDEGVTERYWIPEKNARIVEKLLREDNVEMRIEFMVRKDKSVAIRALYVDDVPLEDYLRRLPVKTN